MIFLISSLYSVGISAGQISLAQEVVSYSTQGFSVDGPFEVASADSKQLTLSSAPENIVVNLNGKKVSVKDQRSGSASAGSIQKGKWAYVLSKGNQVVVFLLSSPQTGNSDH
jgi:hypothetical protein